MGDPLSMCCCMGGALHDDVRLLSSFWIEYRTYPDDYFEIISMHITVSCARSLRTSYSIFWKYEPNRSLFLRDRSW